MAGSGRARTSSLIRRLVRGTDYLSRRLHGIEEFDSSDDCLLRIALIRARRTISLADGARVEPGDRVVELHLWNEHLPIPEGAPDLRWAAAGKRRFDRSLALLARHIAAEPRFAAVRALKMMPALTSHQRARNHDGVLHVLGSDWAGVDQRLNLGQRIHRMLDNVWLWALTWTFNPDNLAQAGLVRHRQEFWISRARFIALYGGGAAKRLTPRVAAFGGPPTAG